MTKLPRLYVNGKFTRLVHPVSTGIIQNTKPLSTASMTLPRGEELPSRSWVELFTPYGSAGMFRVRSPHNAYGESTSTAELEHMIAEVGDYLVKAEYSEMIAASSAVSKVFGHYKGGKWKLGKVSDLGSGKIALECKYESVLSVLLAILQQKPECMMSFDFSTTPWTLNFVKKGTSVVSEGRLSRNVTSAVVTYDDSELCTRCWYQTWKEDKEGNITGKWVSKDADTLKTYGVVEGKVNTSADMTAAEINAVVDNFLKAHKHPKTSVRIQAVELNKITGERRDKYVNGDLHRLAMPDYNMTVELNIESISWADVYGDPQDVEISLGEEEDSVVTFLHNLDATGSGTGGGGGGGGNRNSQEEVWKEYRTSIEQTDYKISLNAQKVDRANNILEQAGMYINSKGVLIYAQDKTTNIMSKINVQSDRIDLVVSGTGKNAKIKSASIMMAVNNDGSSIKINADKIHLEGYVTASSLEATNALISSLRSGQATFSLVNTSSIRLAGYSLYLGSVTIDGTSYNVVRYGMGD